MWSHTSSSYQKAIVGSFVQIDPRPSIKSPSKIDTGRFQNTQIKISWIVPIRSPWWMRMWARIELRIVKFLPWNRINLYKSMNLSILKSADSEACLPSLPTMPIPAWASRIIVTSLPPSPTAAHFFLACLFTILTTWAFYKGPHLQIATDGAMHARDKNLA